MPQTVLTLPIHPRQGSVGIRNLLRSNRCPRITVVSRISRIEVRLEEGLVLVRVPRADVQATLELLAPDTVGRYVFNQLNLKGITVTVGCEDFGQLGGSHRVHCHEHTNVDTENAKQNVSCSTRLPGAPSGNFCQIRVQLRELGSTVNFRATPSEPLSCARRLPRTLSCHLTTPRWKQRASTRKNGAFGETAWIATSAAGTKNDRGSHLPTYPIL